MLRPVLVLAIVVAIVVGGATPALAEFTVRVSLQHPTLVATRSVLVG